MIWLYSHTTYVLQSSEITKLAPFGWAKQICGWIQNKNGLTIVPTVHSSLYTHFEYFTLSDWNLACTEPMNTPTTRTINSTEGRYNNYTRIYSFTRSFSPFIAGIRVFHLIQLFTLNHDYSINNTIWNCVNCFPAIYTKSQASWRSTKPISVGIYYSIASNHSNWIKTVHFFNFAKMEILYKVNYSSLLQYRDW